MHTFLLRSILTIFVICLMGTTYAQIIPFDDERWDLGTGKIETYKGQESLFLKGELAYLKDVAFTDGIIEFDINFSTARGFMGAVWRMADKSDFEEFYMRPHQSGNPDANQYTPVFHGLASWQLYHGPGYGAPVKYDFDEWMHIKIVVSGQEGEVYIQDMEKPALYIPEMKQELKPGFIGVRTGNFSGAHFANFSYQQVEKPELKGRQLATTGAGFGSIRTWHISEPFAEDDLSQVLILSDETEAGQRWEQLAAEKTGIANLARLHGIRDGKNTVFARLRMYAEEEGPKLFRFGYSDRVRVFLNQNLIYAGRNDYRSRDYRYLGTIGLFDELYLPLEAGWNEVWIAVSENFGGWGIMAEMPDQRGIRFGKVPE